MLLPLVAFVACDTDYCSTVWGNSSCSECVSHFAVYRCAFSHTDKKCKSWDRATPKEREFMSFGPKCDCNHPSTPKPTPEPTPLHEPIHSQCSLFTTCQECSLHYADRNCGWCSESGRQGCIEFTGNETACDLNQFYYKNNAKCGEKIPIPPEPWERYDANATFCYSMTGEWCEKCVSLDPTKHCGWCHSTKECIMGDEAGPYFGECPDWSIQADDKCLGKVTKGAAIAIRVSVGVLITALTLVCIYGCVKTFRKPKNQEPRYDEVQ